MSWADIVKATGLAALAERKVSPGRIIADAPWIWNPHDVWLSRAGRPRKVTAPSSMTDPTIPPHPAMVLHD